MSELKACPFCGNEEPRVYKMIQLLGHEHPGFVRCDCVEGVSVARWQSRPIEDELQRRIDELTAELAALKSEIVSKDKKLTDYEKELRKLHNYDKTCSTCRYLDENQDCVLGIRCVNYSLWQGRIL